MILSSILISLLFGESAEQFSFIKGFSFNGSGIFGAMATITLAAILEDVTMTQNTKCIETLMVTVAAIIIVLTNRDMFFEKRHIGHILE